MYDGITCLLTPRQYKVGEWYSKMAADHSSMDHWV